METMETLIAEHPFFRGLEPAHLAFIAGCAVNARFSPNQFLFHEEEEATQFFLIRHGHVALEIHIPGRGPVAIQTVGTGEVVGWSWLFPPYRWHYTARAVELTRAVAFDGTCLRAKCDSDHDLGYELMKRFAGIISQRLQATRLQLLDIYSLHPYPTQAGLIAGSGIA